MIKMVALFRKKDGVSREEFIRHYEENHVPLVLKHMPSIAEYRRSYVLPDTMIYAAHMSGDAPPPPPFDVITELWCENEAKLQEVKDATSDPEVAQIIADDEARFMDRSSMVMFIVDERKTSH